MEEFKAVILSAGFVAVVISLFECIFPAEKYSSQLKYIFSLVLILTAVSPFIDGDINFTDTGKHIEYVSGQAEENTENIFAYFKKSVENNINTNIMNHLEENKIKAAEIKTSINISDSGSININEIEIAVENTAQEVEIVALIQEYTGEDTYVKIRGISGYEQQ